ncbi:MAG: hypothetical protein HZC40_17920 [Chloroflexi bacterium]|nr:hypothetical protein [Chloroflexota bacterium]
MPVINEIRFCFSLNPYVGARNSPRATPVFFSPSHPSTRVGLAAFESVKMRAKDKDATLSVYRLDGELTALIAGSAQRDALYETLSNDLTSFELLMAKLKKEAHTGHIEIALNDGGAGLVFLQNGAVAATVYSANGATLTGADALTKLGETVQGGASFNVYKSDPSSALGQDFMRLEVLETWQAVLAAIANQVDRATAPGVFATAFKPARSARSRRFAKPRARRKNNNSRFCSRGRGSRWMG